MSLFYEESLYAVVVVQRGPMSYVETLTGKGRQRESRVVFECVFCKHYLHLMYTRILLYIDVDVNRSVC